MNADWLITSAIVVALSSANMAVAAGAPDSRVPLVSDAAAAPAVADFFNGMRASGAQPLTMHRAVANAPELFTAYVGMARAIRNDNHVPRPLRELAILRTLQLESGEYEIEQHTRMARSCGMSGEQIAALDHWRTSTLFTPEQRAILGWAEGMATTDGPDPASYDAMAKLFDPHAIVEITLTAGFYAMSARTTKALAIRPQPSPGTAGGYGAC